MTLDKEIREILVDTHSFRNIANIPKYLALAVGASLAVYEAVHQTVEAFMNSPAQYEMRIDGALMVLTGLAMHGMHKYYANLLENQSILKP